jgi:2-oxoglutarate dehydrogenase E2 component (dihydrolipoamide succinyltransferase)
MAIQVKVPGLGESVKNAKLLKWHKGEGEAVKIDEPICELESDKANTDVNAESAGILHPRKREGDTVDVGEIIAEIDPQGTPAKASAAAASTSASSGATATAATAAPAAGAKAAAAPAMEAAEDFSPAVRRLLAENQLDAKLIRGTGPKGRLTKEDVEAYLEARKPASAPAGLTQSSSATAFSAASTSAPVFPAAPAPAAARPKDVATVAEPQPAGQAMMFDSAGIHRAPLSRMRKRIAETLVQAQHTAAILTTINEVDLTSVIELRQKFKDRFQEVHGVGLGFMSFFARACVLALKEFPKVNAFLDGDNVVYHQYVHLGIAVSTDRGLAVPVLRHAEKMSFAKVESEIKRLAAAVRDGKLSLDELSGGTFTITNGGIFGSLLSTPILNPPQSGILGMHAIQKRPVVVNDKIEIRSMMYIALSYDHRLVDGRESVSFLVRLKQYLEDPARLMLEI